MENEFEIGQQVFLCGPNNDGTPGVFSCVITSIPDTTKGELYYGIQFDHLDMKGLALARELSATRPN